MIPASTGSLLILCEFWITPWLWHTPGLSVPQNPFSWFKPIGWYVKLAESVSLFILPSVFPTFHSLKWVALRLTKVILKYSQRCCIPPASRYPNVDAPTKVQFRIRVCCERPTSWPSSFMALSKPLAFFLVIWSEKLTHPQTCGLTNQRQQATWLSIKSNSTKIYCEQWIVQLLCTSWFSWYGPLAKLLWHLLGQRVNTIKFDPPGYCWSDARFDGSTTFTPWLRPGKFQKCRGGISLWIQSCHGEVSLLFFFFFVCLCSLCIPYSCLSPIFYIYDLNIHIVTYTCCFFNAFSHPKSIPLSPLCSNNHRETKRKGRKVSDQTLYSNYLLLHPASSKPD